VLQSRQNLHSVDYTSYTRWSIKLDRNSYYGLTLLFIIIMIIKNECHVATL